MWRHGGQGGEGSHSNVGLLLATTRMPIKELERDYSSELLLRGLSSGRILQKHILLS